MIIQHWIHKTVMLLAVLGATEFGIITHHTHLQKKVEQQIETKEESVKDAQQDDHLDYQDSELREIKESIKALNEQRELDQKRMEHDESLVMGMFSVIVFLNSIGVIREIGIKLFGQIKDPD